MFVPLLRIEEKREKAKVRNFSELKRREKRRKWETSLNWREERKGESEKLLQIEEKGEKEKVRNFPELKRREKKLKWATSANGGKEKKCKKMLCTFQVGAVQGHLSCLRCPSWKNQFFKIFHRGSFEIACYSLVCESPFPGTQVLKICTNYNIIQNQPSLIM